jgi:general secretion pathway protein A
LYLQFFGLNEAPFSITPDPAFVYLSEAHREALAHLLYGVGQGGSGGFVQLTGEVGTGKTTLCRCLMNQIPENTRVALVLNPLLTPRELLATICEELGLDVSGQQDSNKAMVDTLNRYLLDQHGKGRRVVVVIDEAQNLSPEALEQVRLLTNLETAKDKLLQMVLLGQPELRDLLQRQDLRQLAQRITARYHLTPLNREETVAYVRHRVKVAGAQRIPFSKSSIRVIHQRSAGVPRLINIIADRALAGAYARETRKVTPALVHAAANEVQPGETQLRSNRWPLVLTTASIAALLVVSTLALGPDFLARFKPVENAGQTGESVVMAEAPPLPEETAEPAPEEVTPGTESAVGAYSDQLSQSVLPAELDSTWLELQNRSAWDSIAALWDDPAGASAIRLACDGVARTGYSCVREYGNWSRIRKLGLPVILVLNGQENQLVPFSGFSAEGLLLGTEEPLEVAPEAIESRWFGEYMVTWPQAPDWPAEIRRGDSGAAVDIVIQLAALAAPAWQGQAEFDDGFESWLRTFQQRHGLKPDGIVGPNTLIYLMAPTIMEPRLLTETGEIR